MIPLMAAAVAAALPTPVPVPATDHQIDYAGFERLTHEVRPEREKRRITLARFQAMAARDGAVILDARSAPAFAGGTSRARSTCRSPISPPRRSPPRCPSARAPS